MLPLSLWAFEEKNKDNKRAYEKIQEKRRALEKLNQSLDIKLKETQILLEISEDTNQVSNAEDLMDLILKKSIGAFSAKYGAILVYDNKTELLKLLARYRPEDITADTKDNVTSLSVQNIAMPVGEGLVQKVFDSGEPLVKGHLQEFENIAEYFGIKRMIKSVVAIPLKRFGSTVGVMLFGNETSAPILEQNQLSFLKTVSSHVAVLLQNSDMWFTSINERTTGLFNKNYFKLRLGQELNRSKLESQAFSLMILELDGFSEIVDRVGETFVNILIEGVAEKIKRVGRRQDARVKLDGPKFAIVFPNCEHSQALLIAEDLRLQIESKKFQIGEKLISLTGSIGLSVYPGNGENVAEIMANTELALKVAKETGNQVRCYESTELDKTQIA